ncbi:hypothetical protein LTR08_000921 [Meristemomyces frigidus]|nr:hypothetical protein LTR08_000921 [Meristemomyces frigidus]
MQKLMVNEHLIGLLCGNAQPDDVLIPVNMRNGPYVALMLRQHADHIFTFVGQSLLNPNWHPCRIAKQCLHCSGQATRGQSARIFDLYIGDEDFVALIGQDATGRERVEVSAEVRLQCLETAVTADDWSSYAVRRPSDEDADVSVLFEAFRK